MRITFHYLAQLKRFAGVAAETIDVAAGCTLPEALRLVGARHGTEFRAALLDNGGGARASLLFFLGNEQVRPDAARPLRDGDEVTILSPMAGG
jgi:molybdopterin converting factor small subunit